MAETQYPKKPQERYEPGELDKTRQHLGHIDSEEAKRIASLLGGEVGTEKSSFVQETERLKRNTPQRISPERREALLKNSQQKNSVTSQTKETIAVKPVVHSQLPPLSGKHKIAIEKLLCSKEYHIVPNYGFFSFLFSLRESSEKVLSDFVLFTLNDYIGHVQQFITSAKKMLQTAPALYREKIEQSENPVTKVLYICNMWDIRALGDILSELQTKPRDVTIVKLIPFIKTLFKPLIRIYYLGDKGITHVFKNAYVQFSTGGTAEEKETLLAAAKDAIAQWYYISGQIVPGLYPLLLRMTLSEYVSQEELFYKRTSKLFAFLDVTKFDILSPQSLASVSAANTNADINADTSDNIEKKQDVQDAPVEMKREPIPESVVKGLHLLDRLFPEAGWLELDTNPDLYPYFQPLLVFKDGFNVLSPSNPLQVTMVLLRILEECFFAFRSINFTFSDECGINQKEDSLAAIFSDWPLYLEDIFNKLYINPLTEYVNRIFAQNDFRKNIYAKKILSNLMWTAKYYFLPYLDFELLVITKPQKESELPPFPQRVHALKTMLAHTMRKIDENIKTHKQNTTLVDAIANPWEPYAFVVPNLISRRLDALSGKNTRNKTNAALLYNVLLIVQVLDWWLNSKSSFAYIDANALPYRISDDETLSPIFSVPVRQDQNEVFMKRLKATKTELAQKHEEKRPDASQKIPADSDISIQN